MTEISIGICAHNEEKNIGKLLDNLLTEQELPQDSEIIVVCSGCTDSTIEIVRLFCEKDKRVKLILERERMGKVSAMNKILSYFSGEILILVSGDTQPIHGSLQSLLRGFSSDEIGVVGGHPVPVKPTFFGRFMWDLHDETLYYLNHKNYLTHASGEMMAMKRGVISVIPLKTVNEDAYITVTAKKKGYRIIYDRKAVVLISAVGNIIDLIRQRRRVLAGHHQIKRMTGQYPTNFESLIFSGNFWIAVTILERMIRKTRILFMAMVFIAVMLSLVANILAFFDRLRGKYAFIWRKIESTKTRLDLE